MLDVAGLQLRQICQSNVSKLLNEQVYVQAILAARSFWRLRTFVLCLAMHPTSSILWAYWNHMKSLCVDCIFDTFFFTSILFLQALNMFEIDRVIFCHCPSRCCPSCWPCLLCFDAWCWPPGVVQDSLGSEKREALLKRKNGAFGMMKTEVFTDHLDKAVLCHGIFWNMIGSPQVIDFTTAPWKDIVWYCLKCT